LRALGSDQRRMLSVLVDHVSCCAQEIRIANNDLAPLEGAHSHPAPLVAVCRRLEPVED
jgi:hypothetical protein